MPSEGQLKAAKDERRGGLAAAREGAFVVIESRDRVCRLQKTAHGISRHAAQSRRHRSLDCEEIPSDFRSSEQVHYPPIQ